MNPVPKGFSKVVSIQFDDAITSAILSQCSRYVFIGTRGFIQIWDVTVPPTNVIIGTINCFSSSTFIHTMKLLPNGKTLIVCGDTNYLTMWNLTTPKPVLTAELSSSSHNYSTFTVSADSKVCYAGSYDGSIAVWDLHNRQLLYYLKGHTGKVNCVDITKDGTTLWSGDLDGVVMSWDLRQRQKFDRHDFESSVCALGCCEVGEWLVVGLQTGYIQVVHTSKPYKCPVYLHMKAVTSLAIASHENWFVSTDRTGLVNLSNTPYGTSVAQIQEETEIVCSDISFAGNCIVTGSADGKLTLYEVTY